MSIPNHFLTGEELSLSQLKDTLISAITLKNERQAGKMVPYLQGQHLALLFDKPSLRTRLSFTVAMRELGGSVVESLADMRKHEEPEDLIRVIEGYCHGVMLRTHHHDNLQRMSFSASIPVINGLSDLHHPCQILADLLTLQEEFGQLAGVKLAYIGDGNNILHSLLLLAPKLGVDLHYCCPAGCEAENKIINRALRDSKLSLGSITSHATPQEAVQQADAVYTDVWTSMGFEGCKDETLFTGFQVSEELMAHAKSRAIVLHCMPMQRGKEISNTLPDAPSSRIFVQSANRLHVQKALLIHCLKNT